VDETLEIIHRSIVTPLDHCGEVKPRGFLWERLDPITYADIDEGAIRDFARTRLEARGLTV
jgi:hypothetical protein